MLIVVSLLLLSSSLSNDNDGKMGRSGRLWKDGLAKDPHNDDICCCMRFIISEKQQEESIKSNSFLTGSDEMSFTGFTYVPCG